MYTNAEWLMGGSSFVYLTFFFTSTSTKSAISGRDIHCKKWKKNVINRTVPRKRPWRRCTWCARYSARLGGRVSFRSRRLRTGGRTRLFGRKTFRPKKIQTFSDPKSAEPRNVKNVFGRENPIELIVIFKFKNNYIHIFLENPANLTRSPDCPWNLFERVFIAIFHRHLYC